MGAHASLTAHRAPRPAPSRIFQPGRLGRRIYQRRAHEFFIPALGTPRSRSAQHSQPRRRRSTPLAHSHLHEHLLRFRLQQRLPRPALSRRISAATHNLRPFSQQRFRRALLRLIKRNQRSQPPRGTRQQRNLRRLPLEQSTRNLRRTSLPLPLLRSIAGDNMIRM